MSQTVLIIDDDKLFLKYIASILEDVGYKTTTQTSANNIIDLIRLTPPDLIILDYNMPGMDGSMVLRKLRSKRMTTPVVILTAESDQSIAVECFRNGAVDFLSKPCDPDYLKIIVNRAIEQHSGTLKDMAFKLLSYASHKDGCTLYSDTSCSCGLVNTINTMHKSVNKPDVSSSPTSAPVQLHLVSAKDA